MRLDVALCLPREAQTVAFARALVAGALGAIGVANDCIEDVRLALSEACSNVVEHAAVDEEYEVHLHIESMKCVIRVVNKGGTFDAELLDAVMPDARAAGGRGVPLMHLLMDRVEVVSDPERGTTVLLEKELRHAEASGESSPDRGEPLT